MSAVILMCDVQYGIQGMDQNAKRSVFAMMIHKQVKSQTASGAGDYSGVACT